MENQASKEEEELVKTTQSIRIGARLGLRPSDSETEPKPLE